MTRLQLLFLGGICAAALVIGFVSGRLVPVPSGAATAVAWQEPPEPMDEEEFLQNVVYPLARTGFLGASEEMLTAANAAAASQQNEENEGVGPPFPPIRSAAILDGEPVAYVLIGEEIIGVKTGDSVNGGWEVESVTLDRLIAKREDETYSAQIFPKGEGEPAPEL